MLYKQPLEFDNKQAHVWILHSLAITYSCLENSINILYFTAQASTELFSLMIRKWCASDNPN